MLKPEMVARKVFINVPWYFSMLYFMFSPFLTQRTKSKWVIARERNVAETLYKFIKPENVSVQYGGLCRPGDLQNGSPKPATEFTVKGGDKVNLEIDGIERDGLEMDLGKVDYHSYSDISNKCLELTANLAYCENLKNLKLQSCKTIDPNPGPIEHLGSCPTLEWLHLQQCQLFEKQGVTALILVSVAIREIVFQDCWGLDNEIFINASICRRVKFLSLERCSLLTTEGLESVVLSWVELQRLRVVSCNNIKDTEVSPALSSLFSVFKELQWRPDSRSLLSSSLAGTGLGKKGGRFFKRV